MPTIDYVAALSAAMSAPYTVTGSSCCGRVYVVPAKDHKRGLRAAAKKLGARWLPEAYGTSRGVLYVGYDNADGNALARGAAMVAALKAHGVDCYRDEVTD